MGEEFDKKYQRDPSFADRKDGNGKSYLENFHAVSQTKKPSSNLTKHFFVKDSRVRKVDGYNNFSYDLLDSYLSRILHKIIPHAPKGKIAESNIYVSRAYPLDSYAGSKKAIHKYTIDNLLKGTHPNLKPRPHINKIKKLDGLLKSVVFNIVTENWDTKLNNIAAYPTNANDVYKVAAFDLEYALQRDKTYNKIWNRGEIESLVLGTGTESGKINVAEALAETLADVGSRTTGYYVDQKETDPAKPNFGKNKFKFSEGDKNKLIIWLGRELSEINPNHSLALLHVFKDIIVGVETHAPSAYEKTVVDTAGKLPEREQDLHKFMDQHKERLSSNVTKFKGFIQEIEKGLTPGQQVSWVEKSRSTPKRGLGVV